jgi:hypothetical protein
MGIHDEEKFTAEVKRPCSSKAWEAGSRSDSWNNPQAPDEIKISHFFLFPFPGVGCTVGGYDQPCQAAHGITPEIP